MHKVMITAEGWVLCGNCGRKLARIRTKDGTAYANTSSGVTCGRGEITGIEFKCPSCKEINAWNGIFTK